MASCLKSDAAFQRGFTMTELITIIVIVGILSAMVVPRFFDRNTFDSRGFYDQTISTLRYAQKVAIAQHRNVCVTYTLPAPGTITLRIASANGDASLCDTQLTTADGTVGYTITAPAGITFDALPADFNFNALGRASAAVAPIAVGGYTITIDQETGYVR
jgi:MSHA pilin protein MshC